MIKLVIFDLDGVLLDARDIHYYALNRALREVNPEYEISREEHLSLYDGLPTKRKLQILTERKHLDPERYEYINMRKQFFTIKELSRIENSPRLGFLVALLKYEKGLKLAVASNSIRETIKVALMRLGIYNSMDIIMSNQDVKNPKPNPEIYLRCMVEAGVSPKETLIVEDSPVGRRAALESGAKLCPVNNPGELTEKRLLSYLEDSEFHPKWEDKKLNILIPMAGAGSRFAQAGYTFPKPLIEIKNMQSKPMIQVVIENLNIDANYIFIVQKDHFEKYNLKQFLNLITPNCKIVQVDSITEGAACTTLLAKDLIDNDEPLLIANSDQFIEWDSNAFMFAMQGEADAGIVTFDAYGIKWSFVKINENGLAIEVAEKNPISNIGTVGVYWWAKGADYVKYAEQMISKDIRVNGEFYVAPVFNEAIADGKKIKTYHIEGMYGLGTPEDLEYFIENKKDNNVR